MYFNFTICLCPLSLYTITLKPWSRHVMNKISPKTCLIVYYNLIVLATKTNIDTATYRKGDKFCEGCGEQISS